MQRPPEGEGVTGASRSSHLQHAGEPAPDVRQDLGRVGEGVGDDVWDDRGEDVLDGVVEDAAHPGLLPHDFVPVPGKEKVAGGTGHT